MSRNLKIKIEKSDTDTNFEFRQREQIKKLGFCFKSTQTVQED